MKQLNDTLKIKDKRSFILPPKGSNFSDWRSIKPASGISADGFEVQIEENEVISLKYI